MLNNKKEFKMNYGGKEITLETGRLAKQADAAILASCEGTQVLVTLTCAKEVNDGQDFFPLLVDYKEKFYAAGKFLGGFLKREGRPSNAEILIMRLIDRPLRPLFPEGFMNETILMAQVVSQGAGDSEVLAGLGAAAALAISDVPFNGPMGYAKVGKVDGKLILNPTKAEWDAGALGLLVAGSAEAVLMVEGESNEVSEAEMLEAIVFGHNNIKEFCKLLDKMTKEVGQKKREFTPVTPNAALMTEAMKEFSTEARKVLSTNVKQERSNATNAFRKHIKEALKANPAKFGLTEETDFGKEAAKVTDEVLYKMMRADILNENKRIAGRGLNVVRAIETETSVLQSVHGSALFTRGETQVLAAVTIGGKEGEQMYDSIHGVGYDKFYLHYAMPPFSVGEAKGYRGVGRREIGHGNLAERALKKAMPSQTDFPYTVRVACEVLESNGSSSMGSVCSGSMALMDAGVPLKGPVAGVAMGLIKEGDKYKILTDILGDEDHLGDMDFKLAGTAQGITAIQMDMKIAGISEQIFREALAQAKEGRTHILGEMAKTISTNRIGFKAGVPQIKSFKIAPDKIGALIGPGGKNIKALQENFKVTMDVAEDGTVKVLGVDVQKIDEVIALADMQLNGPKIGAIYKGTVVTIKEYGAFVDIVPGLAGLVHVSEIADERVNDPNDYLTEGQLLDVKVLEVDRFGKIKLSAKAVAPVAKKAK
ncbi:polyribonucleotide nucleotidyltransferase [Peredibacter sp. HCB2-198]|uniref:polyribonucleotide nucleotidyltransferase n=1 Tax=Peredibacter sp. HCB2-198 TaxID=3383025 RepID=UPI0038B69B13